MLSLVSSLLGFASAGLPKVLEVWQQSKEQKHELNLMAAQRERELALAKEGFIAQIKIEEVKLDQIALQTQTQERLGMYKHDSQIGEGASQSIINLRASVRPVVTYIFVLLLVVVDVAGIWYAYSTAVPFAEAIQIVFSDDELAMLAAILSFWFGSQAWNKRQA